MQEQSESIQPVRWQDNALYLLDQRTLPHQQQWLRYEESAQVAAAIKQMVVRGAPAIGVTAAYAMVLAARLCWQTEKEGWKQAISAPLAELKESRPTAVNLFWALAQMYTVYQSLPDNTDPEPALLRQAVHIHRQDIEANQRMGCYGAKLLAENSTVLTHCNAGALATAGYGTALGVIRTAFAAGKIRHVYVNETRPWLQGSRLTAWELMQQGIPMTLQSDSVAGSLMATDELDWIIVGADRIAANGDTANKIGTYSLAVLAKCHDVKVMVVASTSTIDWHLADGTLIPVEQRDAREVTHLGGQAIAPAGVKVANPAFDVTRAELIDVIVTEQGVVLKPDQQTMMKLKNSQ